MLDDLLGKYEKKYNKKIALIQLVIYIVQIYTKNQEVFYLSGKISLHGIIC